MSEYFSKLCNGSLQKKGHVEKLIADGATITDATFKENLIGVVDYETRECTALIYLRNDFDTWLRNKNEGIKITFLTHPCVLKLVRPKVVTNMFFSIYGYRSETAVRLLRKFRFECEKDLVVFKNSIRKGDRQRWDSYFEPNIYKEINRYSSVDTTDAKSIIRHLTTERFFYLCINDATCIVYSSNKEKNELRVFNYSTGEKKNFVLSELVQLIRNNKAAISHQVFENELTLLDGVDEISSFTSKDRMMSLGIDYYIEVHNKLKDLTATYANILTEIALT